MKEKKDCVIGIDPSISHPGFIAIFRDGTHLDIRYKDHDRNRYPDWRLSIFHFVQKILEQFRPCLVVIEGLSYGSRTALGCMGEVSGVMKLTCLICGARYLEIPPTVLKKYITGSGIAKKSDMKLAIYKRWGVEIPPPCNEDYTDAYGLARIGYDYEFLFLKNKKHQLSKVQIEILKQLHKKERE